MKPKYNTGQNHFVTTTEDNSQPYTHRQIERAKEARKLYHIIGTPTVQNFKAIIKSNQIKNCPITLEDIDIASKIFVPDIASLKGKSTRTKTTPVIEDNIQVPTELINNNVNVELCIDTMYVNGMTFLTSIDCQV